MTKNFNKAERYVKQGDAYKLLSYATSSESVEMTDGENLQTKIDNLTTHTTDKSNPHGVTKSQVGLGNVDNTSDANKPISTATQTALDKKANLASPTLTGTPKAPTATVGTNTTQIATTAFVQTAVANLVDSAPETLNTLGELATAIEEHQDVTDALDAAISNKVDKEEGKGLFSGSYKDLTDTPTLVAGENVTITNDESTNEITISSSVDKASVVNTVSGNNPTATNSANGSVIYLNNAGYAEQNAEKYLTEFTSNGNFLRTNKIPCKKGDTVAFTSTIEYDSIYMFIYNGETEITSLADVNVNKLEVTIPSSEATHVVFEIEVGVIVGGDGATTNTNTVTVNGSEYTQPSPDNPIRIGGLADKGYFDGVLLQGYYALHTGVFVSDNTKVASANMIPCNANDSIQIKYEESIYGIAIVYFDSDKNYVTSTALNNVSEIEHTAPANAKYFHFYLAGGSNTISPSTAKHISVTINGQYALRVKTENKNLLDCSNLVETTLHDVKCTPVYENGFLQYISLVGTASGWVKYLLNTYTLNAGSYIMNTNRTENNCFLQVFFNGKIFAEGENKQFTLTEATRVQVFLIGQIDKTFNGKVYPMIRLASITDDTYEPHQETEALIPVSAPFYNGDFIEVYADGTGREYRVNYSSLLPKSGWTVTDETDSKQANIYSQELSDALGGERQEMLSTHFGNTNTNKIVSYRGSFWVKFPSEYTTEEITNIFANNDIMYVGKLATPTSTPLTQEQVAEFMKLQTFKPVTHITADGEVTVRYYCDNASGETVSMLQGMVEETNESVNGVASLVEDTSMCYTYQWAGDYGIDSTRGVTIHRINREMGAGKGNVYNLEHTGCDYGYYIWINTTDLNNTLNVTLPNGLFPDELFDTVYPYYIKNPYYNAFSSYIEIKKKNGNVVATIMPGQNFEGFVGYHPNSYERILESIKKIDKRGYDNKPMYKLAADFTSLPNNKTDSITIFDDLSSPNYKYIWIDPSESFVKDSKNNVYPISDANWSFYLNGGTIYCKTTADMSAYSAVITIKYTDNADY